MKWYDSVKVKLIGFFIVISIVFLISMIITFFIIRENNLEKNASKSAALATSTILQHISTTQIKAEQVVLTLASVTEKEIQNHTIDQSVVSAILDTDKQKSINIVSGGVWFEPYVKNQILKNHMLFYNLDKSGVFSLIEEYPSNFREMEFYTLAKKLPKGQVVWTSTYNDPATKVHMITVASPIYDRDTFIGVASLDIRIGNYNKLFWSQVESSDMYLILLDKIGNIIGSSSSLEKIMAENNIFKIQNADIQNLVQKMKPVLTHTIVHTHKNKHDLLNKIFFIDRDPIFHGQSIVSVYHFPETHWNVIIGTPKEKIMAPSDQTFKTILIVITLLTLVATVVGYILLKKIFVDPIESINEQLKQSLSKDGKHYGTLHSDDKGEIGLLVDNLNARTLALKETQKREANEISRRIQNEKMLLQQSKMAAMGEMMDAVAHQWKQPLNALSMYSEIIKNDFEDGSVDQAYIEQFRKDLQTQIDHMVNTLDEFRTFFSPNKEDETFSLLSIVHSVLFLTKDDLLKNRINVIIEKKDHIDIEGSANEFKHLLLNIINNAKDAFNENNIEKREIHIRLINDDEGKRMEIEDNAGGIPEEIIDDIFKAHVTTKEEGKGTGIGLYMSTQIASKYHAKLTVKNQNDGACFTVVFKV